MSVPTLTLEVGMNFFTWNAAFKHIKQWACCQGFCVRKGRSEKAQNNDLKKQTIVCQCEGVYNNNIKKNKNKPSKHSGPTANGMLTFLNQSRIIQIMLLSLLHCIMSTSPDLRN